MHERASLFNGCSIKYSVSVEPLAVKRSSPRARGRLAATTEDGAGRDADEPGAGRRSGPTTSREEFLAAARALFAERGLDRTSVRAIAAAAGVDPALVMYSSPRSAGSSSRPSTSRSTRPSSSRRCSTATRPGWGSASPASSSARSRTPTAGSASPACSSRPAADPEIAEILRTRLTRDILGRSPSGSAATGRVPGGDGDVPDRRLHPGPARRRLRRAPRRRSRRTSSGPWPRPSSTTSPTARLPPPPRDRPRSRPRHGARARARVGPMAQVLAPHRTPPRRPRGGAARGLGGRRAARPSTGRSATTT